MPDVRVLRDDHEVVTRSLASGGREFGLRNVSARDTEALDSTVLRED